ncbi:MAG: hydrogenase maturation nickel metallochaperone HypA [Nitrospirales bacterium]
MHELQLLQQVVKTVEAHCPSHPDSQLSLIRLNIGSHSHLAGHTQEELQATFQFAARGTRVESARLKIDIQKSTGTCQSCHAVFDRGPETYGCPECLSGDIEWRNQPELIITDIEFLESVP